VDNSKEATEVFKQISASYLVLKDPDQRKLAEKQFGRSTDSSAAMVPFTNALSRRSASSPPPPSTFSPSRREPPRHAQSMAPYEDPYYDDRDDRGYAQRRDRAAPPQYQDLYDEPPSEYYDRKERQVAPPASNDPFAMFNSMFDSEASGMFGGFGGGGGGGGGNLMSRARQTDPFAMFNGMFGDSGGRTGGGAPDPFSSMFDSLSLGQDGHQQPARGAFASQRVTRRHVSPGAFGAARDDTGRRRAETAMCDWPSMSASWASSTWASAAR
jgi:DnaJ-class molecular chaperone